MEKRKYRVTVSGTMTRTGIVEIPVEKGEGYADTHTKALDAWSLLDEGEIEEDFDADTCDVEEA